jgi:hypothetical protein
MGETGAIRRLGGHREDAVPASLAPGVEAVWSYARPVGAPSLPGRGRRVLPHEGVNLLLVLPEEEIGALGVPTAGGP